jgi:hypothetical protein
VWRGRGHQQYEWWRGCDRGRGAGSGEGRRCGLVQGHGGRCDAVRKMFAALDGGDKAAADDLVAKSKGLFDGVVKAAGTTDKQLASNASAMAQMMDFGLPEAPIYQSELAEVYAVDCVAQYGAAALPS